ncbi:hypothetical protein LI003_23915, partial [Bacteroides caccae]|uniref:hypothetical protein n=1 Tax=Bacteroides caccae TaxID=47678 RepID=UPI001D0906C7
VPLIVLPSLMIFLEIVKIQPTFYKAYVKIWIDHWFSIIKMQGGKNVKKIINHPEHVVTEMLEGLVAAYPNQ